MQIIVLMKCIQLWKTLIRLSNKFYLVWKACGKVGTKWEACGKDGKTTGRCLGMSEKTTEKLKSYRWKDSFFPTLPTNALHLKH